MQMTLILAATWEQLKYEIKEIPFARYVISASVGIFVMGMCLWGRGWFDMIVINPIMPWQSLPTVTLDWASLPSAFSIFATGLGVGSGIWLSILTNEILNTDTAIR